MGTLFVVASPIGNLGDITARALEVLRTVTHIAAEDTRRTRALLTHFGISGKSLRSLHAHSTDHEARAFLALLDEHDLALLSDAGTPMVNDPGEALIRDAAAAGHRVVPIPGASAVLAALVGSGVGANGFRFVGFLPQSGGARAAAIAKVVGTEETVILFEAPGRTQATLAELAERQPTRHACVARELTKLHEEFVRGDLRTLAAREEWRGEIVIVLGPHAREVEAVDDARIDARIDSELAKGTHPKTIADMLATWAARPRREIYARVVARKRG